MGRVSFSQYNMWSSCPQQYKLNYIDKLGESSGNIHTIFGSCDSRNHSTLFGCDVQCYKETDNGD